MDYNDYLDKVKEIKKQYPWFEQCDFEVPVGWIDLIFELCAELEIILREDNSYYDYRVYQVKDKYGSLRWYDNMDSDELYDTISKYEEYSIRYCVDCGEPAEYATFGWLAPVCEKCVYERKDQRASVLERVFNIY